MNSRTSGDLKSQLSEYIKIDGLNEKIQGTIVNYLATMHNLSEGTKEAYLVRLRRFALFLMEHKYDAFEDVGKEAVDEFLSTLKNHSTVNGYITTLKPFYREFLNKEEVVARAHFY